MSLTPGKDLAVHVLPGTIYEKVVGAPYTYHMYAPIGVEAKLVNPVWTIWREHDTGQKVPPVVAGVPQPDGNVGSNPAGLTYWTT